MSEKQKSLEQTRTWKGSRIDVLSVGTEKGPEGAVADGRAEPPERGGAAGHQTAGPGSPRPDCPAAVQHRQVGHSLSVCVCVCVGGCVCVWPFFTLLVGNRSPLKTNTRSV